MEAWNLGSDYDERDYGSNKLRRHSENPRPLQQGTNKDISKEPSTSSGPGDSREDLGSAVSGYSSFSSKEVTSLHPESCSQAEDPLHLRKELPSSQEILDRNASKYLREISPSTREGFHDFLRYMESFRKGLLLDPVIEARNRDRDDDKRDYGSYKLRRHSENPRPLQQETNKDISKEPSTSSGPGDSRGDLGSAVSGYSSFLSKEVTSLHPESWLKAEVTSDRRNTVVTEMQLWEISDYVGNFWKKLGPLLCITASRMSLIDEQYRSNRDKAMAVLMFWKHWEGHNATVGRLADVMEKVGGDDISEILLSSVHLKMESKKDLRKISPLTPEGFHPFMQYLESIKNLTVLVDPVIEARNRDRDDDKRDYGSYKLRRHSENPRPLQQETNKDISKEPSTSSGPGDSRGDLGSAVSGYSSFLSKEVTSLHPESWLKAEDVLQLDKLSIVSEPSRKSAHEGESVEGPEDDHSKDPGEVPMATASGVRDIRAATMLFEAKHEKCIRVLPYIKDGQIVVQFYVYGGKSGIPKYLKEEAQTFFEDMGVKLEWSDLYNNSDIILKVQPLECSNGKPKTLTAVQADEMNEVIEKNLRVLSKYRNLTSVQASFKIKNSKQLDKPCITIHVLGKGFIPLGESRLPDALEGYPVDVVNGFWTKACPNKYWEPNSAQKPSKTLCSGVSIGVKGKEEAGTLGAIVKNGSTFYALSCHHVMNSEQSKRIVHPALYDHLNYLRYYLAQYRRVVKDVTGLEAQGSVNKLTTREALVSNFKELKSRKDLDIQVQVYSSECLEQIGNAEKDFERGQDPPREIGEWVDGVSDNFQWTDNKDYFIDAAIAKLFDKEVESLKNTTARLIGNDGKPCGCSPADKTTISNANQLCKSGRTTVYTEIGDRILGNLEAPHFIMPPLYEKDLPFLSCHLKVFACERCDKKKFKVTDSREPLSCDKCDERQATFRNEFWRRRVLCIREERTRFADDGDSGSVIFKIVEKEGGNDLFGLGLLFAIDESQYKRLYFASPLRIVLDALNNKLPTGSNLELVSNYNE